MASGDEDAARLPGRQAAAGGGRWLKAAAVLVNLALLAAGVALMVAPSRFGDRRTGLAAAVVAALNCGAILLAASAMAHLAWRLRRIALFLNALLIVAAGALSAVSLNQQRALELETAGTLALLLLPLLSCAAILAARPRA